MTILGTGLTGLLGSRIEELLVSAYTFEHAERSSGFDLTNAASVAAWFQKSSASIVLHCAAKTNVDACEDDKELEENGEAWKINVEGTRNVAKMCKQYGKKLIFISTDFVFDGKKESYTEEDVSHPINWYGQTKFEGEKVVQAMGIPSIIARIAFPYRSQFPKKNDFVHGILERLKNQQPVAAVCDQYITPTFIDDIAAAIDVLIKEGREGIYHIVGSESLTPYEAALRIANIFGYNESLVKKTTRQEFFSGRAARPFQLRLKNDKIQKLGISMKGFTQGLEEIQKKL